ncbi:hypothetical protein [Pararhizobium sp.]|uniref:hypothetical protein n=1 Tax=Pararhizobium sp. TaxID=1977563 RepID=UPI002719279E|nr:hypothetical protein [Pararhizobium sp.]MDO9416287.1 hypothetical protein [Pararhizobium sp.]
MRTLTISTFMLLLSSAALAQEQAPGRYSMEKTDAGIVRLDTQTGEISVCSDKGGNVTCRLAADERTAFELELDLLTKRIETLEKTVGTGVNLPRPSLPSNEEIDQAMSIMERMMQKFMGIVKDLDKDTKTPEEAGKVPDKT